MFNSIILSCCIGFLAQAPQLLQPEWGVKYSVECDAGKENVSPDWMIGGKIHFEEQSASDYIGIVEINELTRKVIKKFINIQVDLCGCNAKVLLKQENDQIIISHKEERSKPGIGEELHATLLYTSKRVERGHETLRDIYDNLRHADPSLPQDRAPTVEQVANAYQKIIKADWRLRVSDVQLISNEAGSFIIANLKLDDRDEILNDQGLPVSGDFLHLTLAVIDPSIPSRVDKIRPIVSELKEALTGKMVKIGNKNGYADLEFGLSGSGTRVRPSFGNQVVNIKSKTY